MTLTSSLRWVCCMVHILVSVLPDNLPFTEAPLSQSEIKILHPASSSLKSPPLRHGAVYQSQEGEQWEIILQLPRLKPKSHISGNGCSRWKSGKVVRDQRNTAAAVVVWWGPLWTPKKRDSRITQDHKLYAVFHYADIHLTQGSGL